MNPFITRIRIPMLIVVAILRLSVLANAQTPLLEVDKGEVELMQVNDDGGLVVRGNEGGAIPASGDGFRMMWYPGKAAFRAGAAIGGTWDNANVGRTSVAMGAHTLASGEGATALGIVTEASGRAATAMGDDTKASGESSTAMGYRSEASGVNATAMGFQTQASGEVSTAIGSNARALGQGSFAYGDASSGAPVAALTNMFVVRASGGILFRTSPDQSTGCNLQSLGGTWDCTSSRLAKENFQDLDGEAVLHRLAGIRIQRWRYRGTDVPHVGPTAEDFFAAFQLGTGSTTISTVDADGISLRAIQALERRTAQLLKENAELRRRLEALEAIR